MLLCQFVVDGGNCIFASWVFTAGELIKHHHLHLHRLSKHPPRRVSSKVTRRASACRVGCATSAGSDLLPGTPLSWLATHPPEGTENTKRSRKFLYQHVEEQTLLVDSATRLYYRYICVRVHTFKRVILSYVDGQHTRPESAYSVIVL